MKLDIQMFGGRGASSGTIKNSGRAMLQDRINKETTKLNGNENVFIIKNDKVIQKAKLRNINNKQYEEELRKPVSKVIFRKEAKTFMIYQEEKKRK